MASDSHAPGPRVPGPLPSLPHSGALAAMLWGLDRDVLLSKKPSLKHLNLPSLPHHHPKCPAPGLYLVAWEDCALKQLLSSCQGPGRTQQKPRIPVLAPGKTGSPSFSWAVYSKIKLKQRRRVRWFGIGQGDIMGMWSQEANRACVLMLCDQGHGLTSLNLSFLIYKIDMMAISNIFEQHSPWHIINT